MHSHSHAVLLFVTLQGWDLTGPGLLPLQQLCNLISLNISRSPLISAKAMHTLHELSPSLHSMILDSVAITEPRDLKSLSIQQQQRGLHGKSEARMTDPESQIVSMNVHDERVRYGRGEMEALRFSQVVSRQVLTTLLRAGDTEGQNLIVSAAGNAEVDG